MAQFMFVGEYCAFKLFSGFYTCSTEYGCLRAHVSAASTRGWRCSHATDVQHGLKFCSSGPCRPSLCTSCTKTGCNNQRTTPHLRCIAIWPFHVHRTPTQCNQPANIALQYADSMCTLSLQHVFLYIQRVQMHERLWPVCSDFRTI